MIRWPPKHNKMMYKAMHRSIQSLCGPALPGDVHRSPRPSLTVCSALIPTLKGGATGGLYIHVSVRSNPCILYPVSAHWCRCEADCVLGRFNATNLGFLCDFMCVRECVLGGVWLGCQVSTIWLPVRVQLRSLGRSQNWHGNESDSL